MFYQSFSFKLTNLRQNYNFSLDAYNSNAV